MIWRQRPSITYILSNVPIRFSGNLPLWCSAHLWPIWWSACQECELDYRNRRHLDRACCWTKEHGIAWPDFQKLSQTSLTENQSGCENSEIVQTYTNVLGHPCAKTKRNEHNHGMNLKAFVWRTTRSKIPYHCIHECESVWSSFEAFEGVTENQSDRGEFETTDSSEDLKKVFV